MDRLGYNHSKLCKCCAGTDKSTVGASSESICLRGRRGLGFYLLRLEVFHDCVSQHRRGIWCKNQQLQNLSALSISHSHTHKHTHTPLMQSLLHGWDWVSICEAWCKMKILNPLSNNYSEFQNINSGTLCAWFSTECRVLCDSIGMPLRLALLVGGGCVRGPGDSPGKLPSTR